MLETGGASLLTGLVAAGALVLLLVINYRSRKKIRGLMQRVDEIAAKSNARPEKSNGNSPLVEELHESVSWLPDAVVVLDSDLCMNWANPTAEKWLGFKLSQHTHMDITTLIGNADLVEFIRSRNHEEGFDCAAPGMPEIIIRVRILPYKHGQHLLQARDVTQVKTLEHIRRDFVANASHELRTPISILYGYLDIMLQDDRGEISNEWKPAINQMYDQTARVKQIIEDMMMLSRLEDPDAGEEHTLFEMGPLIESVAKNARVLSGDHSHRISTRIEGEYQLLGSQTEIESLVTNLVSNSVRYTPDQGEIKISWESGLSGGVLYVSDTGIGIEETAIPRLTERFYRTDTARSRETGGTGLGLAIVNHIISRHQAELAIESKPGQGSTFSVTFPPQKLARNAKFTNLTIR